MFAQFAAILQSLATLIQALQAQLQEWIDHGVPDEPGPVDPDPVSGPVDAPDEANGHAVVAGTHGDDLMQGQAGVADLFLIGNGADTIEGFEQGLDRIWVRDAETIDGLAFDSIITERETADGGITFGTPATWLPERAGVALALDDGAVEVRGMTEIGAEDWVFGADVPVAQELAPVDEWDFV